MYKSRENAPFVGGPTPRANAAYARAARASHNANAYRLRNLARAANAAANLEKRHAMPLSPISHSNNTMVVRMPRGEVKKTKRVFGNLFNAVKKIGTSVTTKMYRNYFGEHPNSRNARARKRRANSQAASLGFSPGTNVRQAAAALMKMSTNRRK